MDNRISGRCTNYFDGWSHKLAPNLCTCNYIITLFGSSFKVHHNVIAVRKRSLRRLCFSHLYVSHSVHRGGGVCQSACWDTSSGSRHPLPLGADTPQVHAGRYVQQAGGTHPTGMHSCFILVITLFCIFRTSGTT